jgi:hypothetical protein
MKIQFNAFEFGGHEAIADDRTRHVIGIDPVCRLGKIVEDRQPIIRS